MGKAVRSSFKPGKELFHDISKNVDVVFYIYDLDAHREVWSNNKTETLFGYKTDTVSIHKLEFTSSLFHPIDKNIASDRLNYFLSEKGKVWSGIYRIKHNLGHWLWVYTTITRYKSFPSSKPRLLSGIMLDITRNLITTDQIEAFLVDIKRFQNQSSLSQLTKREIQVLKLIARGNSYTRIGKMLNIQPDTVNQHRKNIKRKLNLSNIALLSCFAKETGLV